MIGVYMNIWEIDMTQLLSIHKDNSDIANYKAITQIVDMLDWHVVHKVMKYLDWTWMTSQNGVPEVYELKQQALEYGEKVVAEVIERGDEYFIESGGIRVQAKMYPEGDIWLHVAFILESWDNSI